MQAPNTATHWLASSYGWNEASLEARPVQQVKEAAAASPQTRRAAAVCQVRAPAARAPRRCPELLGWWGPMPCGPLLAQQNTDLEPARLQAQCCWSRLQPMFDAGRRPGLLHA